METFVEFYRRRARQEHEAAAAASDNAIRALHLKMAKTYESIVELAEQSDVELDPPQIVIKAV